MSQNHPIATEQASVIKRIEAIESVMNAQGMEPAAAIEKARHTADEAWVPANGARMVAKAWTDSAYRTRLLADGKAAAAELGFEMPPHHRYLVALENTPNLHNVIVCTLCSCTAFTIIGLPPDWYKDLEYRARAVRESRTVLKEMGLELPATTEIKVWDTTTDTRYMVIPQQPAETIGWPEDKLAGIVTKESMIGVERLMGS
ncbi:nitrile hydratase [Jezberella montanilacus]|jgi:nitrile hydratase|uniref:Nitrile hydratase n=1 Tax=Jezberella montanilacus TaxID=323426 RepID=A0A2T0XG78_9BURK|nr:nitrile hydratase subunit alpha [Jezberella montanilacus]PRY97949.1 nitrile hydratase [Jezberella montanilacus]